MTILFALLFMVVSVLAFGQGFTERQRLEVNFKKAGWQTVNTGMPFSDKIRVSVSGEDKKSCDNVFISQDVTPGAPHKHLTIEVFYNKKGTCRVFLTFIGEKAGNKARGDPPRFFLLFLFLILILFI